HMARRLSDRDLAERGLERLSRRCRHGGGTALPVDRHVDRQQLSAAVLLRGRRACAGFRRCTLCRADAVAVGRGGAFVAVFPVGTGNPRRGGGGPGGGGLGLCPDWRPPWPP